jgi:hypothetical protein
VGAPWEIHRITLPLTKRIVDLYAKSGGIGSYYSELILIPDFEVGFSVLAAGIPGNRNGTILSNLITEIVLPALETAAREHAKDHLIGTYSFNNLSGLESSITLTTEITESGQSGLGISQWISNGKDMMYVLAHFLPPMFARPVQVRLYPSTSTEEIMTNGVHAKLGYRALFELRSSESVRKGTFDRPVRWFHMDQLNWQATALDEFIVECDEEGYGLYITPRALGIVLRKVSSPIAQK